MIELPLDTQAALIALSHSIPAADAPDYFWGYRYKERDRIDTICDCAACTYHWRHNEGINPDRYHLDVL